MAQRFRFATAAGVAHLAFTDRADGDFHVDGDARRREEIARRLVDLPWSWVRQVHGTEVVVIEHPGQGGGDGDALVTTTAGAVLSVRGADCPVVGFISDEGVIGVAHAGWRGLVAGVLERTVESMRALGAERLHAHLGPCISAARYEFGAADLDRVAARLGDGVRGRTEAGAAALDLVAGVGAALARVGVELDRSGHRCTASDPALYSYRARAEAGRHCAAVWLEPADGETGPGR